MKMSGGKKERNNITTSSIASFFQPMIVMTLENMVCICWWVGCGCAGQCLGMKLQQVNFRGKKGKKKGGGLEIIVRDYSQS